MAYITNTKLSLEDITSVNIPSTDALPIDLKKLKGETTQDGTPTPSSPVSIETVTGLQEIDIVGKNLFDYKSTPNGGSNSLEYVTNGVKLINTATGTWLFKRWVVMNIEKYAEQTLTFSTDIKITGDCQSRIVLGTCKSDGSNRSTLGYVDYTSNTRGKLTVTLPSTITSNNNYLYVDLYTQTTTAGTINDYIEYTNIELNFGNDTKYEPYINKSYEINLGKNLYKPISFSRSNGGIDYTYNLDGSINCDGRATSNSYSMLSTDAPPYMFQINTGTYTISGASTSIRLQVIKYDNGSVSTLANTTSSTSFTVNNPTNVYIRTYISNGTTVDNVKVYPQLEKGSQATEYVSYFEPIELCKIGDYQDYIRKSTGKNLFDGEVEQGDYNTTTGEKTSGSNLRSSNYIPISPNTTIKFSINGTAKAINILEYKDDYTYIKYTNVAINNSLTTSSETKYITLFRGSSDGSDFWQLEKGNQATDYEPFGKVWYIHKEINKIVLNGSESGWTVYSTGTANYFYRRTITPLMKTGGLSALTSHYPYTGVYTSNTNQGLYISATETTSQLRIRYGTEDTLDNFKNWLSNNNVSVYYVLETPTDTIIENETLISELETLSNAYSFRPSTNIIQTTQNLPFYIDLDVYSGENVYENVIYSQEDVNKCKIYFNNVELQDADEYLEKITFIKRVLPENGKKIFTLDNFIAEEVEMIIHDIDTSIIQDKVRIELGTLVNNDYVYVPMGVYNIQDTPTRNDNKITIKLRDNACLFDFNYNAKPLIDSLGGTATKMQILQDICSQANVNCNVNSFTGDSDFIGIYDNTVTARMYVAYITEQASCIVKIDRYGNLIFVPLNNLYTHRIPLSIVSKYVKGTPFQIERVVYELGTIKFETSNDESLQTLYISSANPYISVQNDIDRIFPMLENFELDSVEIQKEIIGNPAIDGYDLIEIYDDEDANEPVLFKTLANNTLTYNGKFKSKYKTEIGLEERTENVSKNSNETFKKSIKNEINLVNGTITQTVEEVSTLDDIINGTPTYTITTDTTFQADKPYYKFVDNDYIELVEGTDYNDGDAISSVGYDVYDVVYVDGITDTLNNSIQNQISNAMTIIQSTLLEQTSENFTMWFNQTGVKKDIEDLQGLIGENKTNIENIKAYIEYGTMPVGSGYDGSPYILLGKASSQTQGSQTQLRILDNRIQFLSSGRETAYISNNTLYINESTILTKQIIGNNNGRWITDVDSNGNLNTYWGG